MKNGNVFNFYELSTSTSPSTRSMERLTASSDILTTKAPFGQVSAHLPHTLHLSSSTAAFPSVTWMASTKQMSSVHLPQPVQVSGLNSSLTPVIGVKLFPIFSGSSVAIFQRQQQGQQLQMDKRSSLGPVFNQTLSILFLPMIWTNPASWHFSTCSRASSFETILPSLDDMRFVPLPRNKQPRSCG